MSFGQEYRTLPPCLVRNLGPRLEKDRPQELIYIDEKFRLR